MEDQLSGCVHNSLSLGLYDNARFLAERLVAASGSEVETWSAEASTALELVRTTQHLVPA